jgi:hypothetical protein
LGVASCRFETWRSNGWTTSVSSSKISPHRSISSASSVSSSKGRARSRANLDDTLDRLRKRGAQLAREVVQYQHSYRLCYIRGPEGILIGLAQQLDPLHARRREE